MARCSGSVDITGDVGVGSRGIRIEVACEEELGSFVDRAIDEQDHAIPHKPPSRLLGED